jgi:group I intron endonuclease
MKPYIYKITNLLNGKAYVGQHDGSKNHYYASGHAIKKAVKKYGKENFMREVIDAGDYDGNKLDELEVYYIALHQTYAALYPEKGYNLTVGGGGSRGIKRTEAEKKHLRLVSPNRKPVVQLTVGGVFIAEHFNILEASKTVGVSHSGISRCCKGEMSISAGFKWAYKEEYEKTGFATPTTKVLTKKVAQYTLDGTELRTFESAGDAAKAYGINRAGIANVICGNSKSAAGFVWKLAS